MLAFKQKLSYKNCYSRIKFVYVNLSNNNILTVAASGAPKASSKRASVVMGPGSDETRATSRSPPIVVGGKPEHRIGSAITEGD